LRTEAAALKKPGDTALNPFGHARHFGLAGRSHMPESHFSLFVDDIDPVHRQGMEMGIEPEYVPKALDKGDGAAPSPAVRRRNAGTAADRGKDGTHEDLQNLPKQ